MRQIQIPLEPIPTREAARCRHCGLSLPSGLQSEFCCRGCESVFEILNSGGLTTYYKLRNENPPTCAIPASVSDESFSYCDDPEVLKRFATGDDVIHFFVEGLNCSACLWLIRRLPQICDDIVQADVNFANSQVRIVRKPGGSFARAASALNRIGYRPRLVESEEKDQLLVSRRRLELARIGVAAFCTGNIMIFAVSLYAGAGGRLAFQFAWISAILALPVLTFCAWPFYRSAASSIRHARLNIDVPIVAALVAGVAMSVYELFTREEPSVYFDSLSLLTFLLLSSRFWLASIQRKYLDSHRLADFLLIGSVQRIKGLTIESVSNLSVRVGDRLIIDGGHIIPVDGRVVAGTAWIQSAALTGEFASTGTRIGDRVYAGTSCLNGRIEIVVEAEALHSRLATLLQDAEAAAATKPSLVRFSDRVGAWFVGTVFTLAAGVSLAFLTTAPAEGFSRALALIIVTCPCVFGMAIPLSLSLAVRAAAANGIVIKTGDVVERLASIRTLYFDKTGTLTSARAAVLNFETQIHPATCLAIVTTLEADQDHPVAHALRAYARLHGPAADARLAATSVSRRANGGLEGWIDGRHYSIVPLGASVAPDSSSAGRLSADYGIYENDAMIGRFQIGDEIRADAAGVLGRLAERGYDVNVLSGDRASVVEIVGQHLGLAKPQIYGDASPEEKARRLAQSPGSMMIGDGANDAAALASASVGVAIRGSMDVSMKAADVYLLHGSLSAIEDLLTIARDTRFAIRRNLAFSAAFNVTAGALALGGHMHPLWAAVLMPLSSLTVLGSALLTGRSLSRIGGHK